MIDVLAAAAFLVTLAACSGEKRVCAPSATQTCACPGVTQGARACAADGARWEPCACAPPASLAPAPTRPFKAAALGTRTAECNALIGIINEGVQNLEKGSEAGGDQGGSGPLRAMADMMDKVAADAARLELTIAELQRFSREYQAMARDTAKAARDLAAAADANDVQGSNAAQAAIERAIGREDPLVDTINQFCQAPE
ncbi:hypothetical protein [Sorangium sp. So ce1097]|uniref:hypothetical protein n=1 Tax=Sorangium sp. So ce1097 TaxID=3133330 RepID=UPI003F62EB26